MYLGRIVAIAMNKQGKVSALYRVSSRSFPNRETVRQGDIVSVMPRAGFEDDLKKNPYITYNCVRFAGSWAVVARSAKVAVSPA
ncbi:MAG: IMP cyclohydrolase, partial [Victivallaceae bacterium]